MVGSEERLKFAEAYSVPSARGKLIISNGGNTQFLLNAYKSTGGMVINTQATNYSTGGMVINTQDTNYSNGGMVINTQDTNYSIGGMVINT